MDFTPQPLTDAELDELDEFLAHPTLEDTSMDVSVLDGYLTALLIGPRSVLPSLWLPRVWDMEHAENAPSFARRDEFEHIVELIFRHNNAIAAGLQDEERPRIAPICVRDDCWGVAEWCTGFMLAAAFDEPAWGQLMDEQPELFEAVSVLGLGTDEEIMEEFSDRDAAIDAVIAAVKRIEVAFREARASEPDALRLVQPETPYAREAPKVGRNTSCPCGSGRKFKKCCGRDDRVTN